MEYSDVWILAEQQDGRIMRIAHELLTRGLDLARKRGCKLAVMVFGHQLEAGDLEGLIARGADRVVAMEAPELAHFLVEPYAACMLKIIEQYHPEIIIAGATTTGRTLMPYVAVRCYSGLTADCTQLDIDPAARHLLQTRPAIGGNIMATIVTPAFRPQMATVRPRSTKPAPVLKGARHGEIVRLKAPPDCLKSRLVREKFIPNAEEQGLQEADIVVAVGRGIKKAENLPPVRAFAQAIGAALGASREVVDRGWLSYPHQIGLSGKTINPKLYIGLGVSGSIQHLAGMQTAETIVAVNTDPEAQIFKVADFGIVGDLFEVLPVLAEKVKNGAWNRNSDQ
jgi:electron transfer flavoprotein alpha subunit